MLLPTVTLVRFPSSSWVKILLSEVRISLLSPQVQVTVTLFCVRLVLFPAGSPCYRIFKDSAPQG